MASARVFVLASGSRYRAALARQMCESVGAELLIRPAELDERAFDDQFDPASPERLAVALAEHKARSVTAALALDEADSTASRLVIGADQLLIADVGDGPTLLHQPGTPERACAQLASLSGTTHLLVNGLVGVRSADGAAVTALDIHQITMRRFTEAEAQDYVERFQPLDCVGSYRIEDGADLVERVAGEHRSGIIGLPLPTVGRILEQLGWHGAFAAVEAASGPHGAGLPQSL